LLRRVWSEAWSYQPDELTAAETQLDELFAASARSGVDPAGTGTTSAATDAVLAALRADLDVPTALGIALDEGGAAARTLIEILGLR